MLTPSARREPREPRPQSPQLTLRVALLGGVAVLLFTVIFFRLWVLQVLSSERYRTVATASQLRTVRVAAPRGRILDVNGKVLVDNRPGDAITFDLAADVAVARGCAVMPPRRPDPPKPPTARRLRVLLKGLHGRERARRRAAILRLSDPLPPLRPWRGCARGATALTTLAHLTRTPIWTYEDRIHEATVRAPFEPVTLVGDADTGLMFYLKEHGAEFPGVHIAKRTVRSYPLGTVAAHLFGEIGEVLPADLKQVALYPGAVAGDVVGHSGIERSYDKWLRGKDGTLNVEVNAQGVPQGTATLMPAPKPGRDVRLTIDADVQRAAERAIADGIRIARSGIDPLKKPMLAAAHGALVVMDVKTGAIRAMASYPTFNPNRLVGKGADAYASRLYHDDANAPLLNRAANGVYPPGSTFKPVTAIAALKSGLMAVDDPIHCGPYLVVDHQKYRNFEADTKTDLTLRPALAQSCDTYFYELGYRLYRATSNNGAYQPQPAWMRKLGFGQSTGLDIPDAPGVAPDARYKKTLFGNDQINNRWTSGDAVNASIGQGYVQVTPLQIAALYALIANGGTLVTPHLAAAVQDADGSVVRVLQARARRTVEIEPDWLDTIKAGLRGVTHDGNGTAMHAFAGFPVGVAGKTGTAQKPPLDDYSWFVGYAPIGDPQLVAVCVIEQGGFGGVSAAAAVREVFARAFHAGAGGAPRDLSGRRIAVDETQRLNGIQFGDPTAPTTVPTTTGGG
jgi:penicillin-binding protein 2